MYMEIWQAQPILSGESSDMLINALTCCTYVNKIVYIFIIIIEIVMQPKGKLKTMCEQICISLFCLLPVNNL